MQKLKSSFLFGKGLFCGGLQLCVAQIFVARPKGIFYTLAKLFITGNYHATFKKKR
jgi:hypothetical protein